MTKQTTHARVLLILLGSGVFFFLLIFVLFYQSCLDFARDLAYTI